MREKDQPIYYAMVDWTGPKRVWKFNPETITMKDGDTWEFVVEYTEETITGVSMIDQQRRRYEGIDITDNEEEMALYLEEAE